jgi:8-oxo-dGTP pyrophosphatase MutT (NUDIX family)
MESQSVGQKLGRRVQSRNMDSSLVEGVGTFIYCATTQRYLFLLRNSSKYSGTWGLAGGKIEPDEQMINSLHREISEELGISFIDTKVIPIEKFTSDNGNFVYHTFLIPVAEEFTPTLNYEHRGYCWVRLEDHPKPLHPGVWRTINFEAVMAKIKTLETVLDTGV